MKLEIGYNPSFEIRREEIHAGIRSDFSIMYISDLHFNKHSSELLIELKKAIADLCPDLIILGGDYADSKTGFEHLKDLFCFLSERKNIFAIPGNHDYFFGKDWIAQMALENKIVWLEKTSADITIKENKIGISSDPNQKTNCEFNILCLHQPLAPEKTGSDFQLTLAGHLHGCQIVLWENEKGLYPGKFFYRQNFLKRKTPGSLYLISKGLGDTLPFRYNCKKDLIFVHIKSVL